MNEHIMKSVINSYTKWSVIKAFWNDNTLNKHYLPHQYYQKILMIRVLSANPSRSRWRHYAGDVSFVYIYVVHVIGMYDIDSLCFF